MGQQKLILARLTGFLDLLGWRNGAVMAAAESEFVRTGGRQIPDQDEFFCEFCLAKLQFVCLRNQKIRRLFLS